jgi:hypothetical protein
MRHLDDATAIAVAEGAAAPPARQHLEGCPACAGRVARLRTLLAALADVVREAPPHALLRWAQAYARTVSTTAPRWSFLPFLTEGAPLTAAVRGGTAPGSALLFGDAGHQLDLRVDPAVAGAVRLHGQIVPLDEREAGGWEVIAVTGDGRTLRTVADQCGEFWLEAGGDWQEMSLVAVRDGERLVVPRLRTGPAGTER